MEKAKLTAEQVQELADRIKKLVDESYECERDYERNVPCTPCIEDFHGLTLDVNYELWTNNIYYRPATYYQPEEYTDLYGCEMGVINAYDEDGCEVDITNIDDVYALVDNYEKCG